MSSSRPSAPENQRLELVGRITATVAHDLNNVLTALLAYADFARDESSEPAVHAELDELVRVGRRASTLTRQLLQLARRDDAPVVLDFGERVGELAPTLRRLLPLGVTLRVEIQPGARVRIVPIHVDQLVLNLVLNARDAFDGEGTIVVKVAADATEVRLEVSDDGRGMPPDVLARACEPAFSTKPAGLGTGLGLSTCRSLTRAAGGDLTLESEVGRGTRVRVLLPRSHDEVVTTATAAARLPELRVDGELAVVLDDDRTVLDVATRLLQGAGFRVVGTTTRERFERVLAEHRGEPRLVVVSTSSLDPRHVLGLRTRLAARAGLLVTGLDRSELATEGDVRALAFLAKPFTTSGFVDAAFEARALARDAPSLRVLLVDPHGDARALLSALLRRAGHDVVTAPDVARAEASLSVTQFDLVIVALELGWSPRRRGVPWIGVTSSDDPTVAARALDEGFVDVLVKPLVPRALAEAIDECTSKYRWVLVVGVHEEGRRAIDRALSRTPNVRSLWVESWTHAKEWLTRGPFDLVLHTSTAPAEALPLLHEAGAVLHAIGDAVDLPSLERDVHTRLRAHLDAVARRPPSSRALRRSQLSVEVAMERADEVARFLTRAREQVVSLLAQVEHGEVAGPIAIARELVSGAEHVGLEVVAMLAAELEEHQVEGRIAEARIAVDRLARYLSTVRGTTMRPPP